MRVKEIMTAQPVCCAPDDTATNIALVMRDRDCGVVPIVDRRTARLVGVVTDRDLALRVVATGRGGDIPARDLMTAKPKCCREDDDLATVERLMADYQIRRVPVVDDKGHCVGIISQADLACAAVTDRRVTEHELAIVIERISAQNLRSVGNGMNVRTAEAH